MSNLSVPQSQSYGQALDLTRTATELELEAVTHEITVYFTQCGGCDEEISLYHAQCDEMIRLANGDVEAETHLLLANAKQTYRELFARNWAVSK